MRPPQGCAVVAAVQGYSAPRAHSSVRPDGAGAAGGGDAARDGAARARRTGPRSAAPSVRAGPDARADADSAPALAVLAAALRAVRSGPRRAPDHERAGEGGPRPDRAPLRESAPPLPPPLSAGARSAGQALARRRRSPARAHRLVRREGRPPPGAGSERHHTGDPHILGPR